MAKAAIPTLRSSNAEINRAMQQPDVNAKLTAAGLIVANESAEFFQDYIKSEYEKYGKIVRSIGLEHKL
jgi:tripartite-type tricarboxylate transporter receptor subunit TctC